MTASVAFYAPMKPPDHATPSGDRQIARLMLRALGAAGYRPFTASRLRTLDMQGSEDFQTECYERAVAEFARITAGADKPDLWFTYHSYYKAPDLLGEAVARALDIPYVIAEPSVSPRRREGPWARFAAASEAAIAVADRLLVTTARDRPGVARFLEEQRAGPEPAASAMVAFPPFLDIGPEPAPRPAGDPIRLLAVAMMRPGDKTESYRHLAAALVHMPRDWTLTVIGDGPARDVVRRLFAPHHARVTWQGAVDDPGRVRAAMEDADLLVWPGVGEGVGMVYLEAQAAGLPVVAEDHPAQRDLVVTPLAPPGDAAGLVDLILDMAADRARLSAEVRAHAVRHHSLDAAAARLRALLDPLLAR